MKIRLPAIVIWGGICLMGCVPCEESRLELNSEVNKL